MELYQSNKSMMKGIFMRVNSIRQAEWFCFFCSTPTALKQGLPDRQFFFQYGPEGRLECFFLKGLIANSQIFYGVFIYVSITVFGQSGTCFELLLLKLQL